MGENSFLWMFLYGFQFFISFLFYFFYLLFFTERYMFPRQLLTRHFWTQEQSQAFLKIQMTNKLKHYDSILDYMLILSQYIHSEKYQSQVKKAVNKVSLFFLSSILFFFFSNRHRVS